ncbi:MAG: CHAT domain-containing tetratricopeptide repeat protein [Cyclobacteriaceae bacterium]
MKKLGSPEIVLIVVIFASFFGFSIQAQAQSSPLPTIADSLYQQGNFAGAAQAYHRLVQQWGSLNNTDSAYYYQLREAKSYIQQYEYQKARTLLQAILPPQSSLPNAALLSQVYHEIGYTYLGEDDFQQALEFSEKSIATEEGRAQPDTFQLAKYYEIKGFMLMQVGNYAAAEQWATTAHQLRKAVLDPMDKELGYSANTLYIILDALGKMYEADTVLSEAWTILNHNLPEDHPHIAIVANNYSTHLLAMGEPQRAKDYLLRAIASNKKGARYYPLAGNYVNLGMLYMNLSENKTAESYYQQAWSIIDTLVDYPDYDRANIKDALGAVYYNESRLEEADSMFREAFKEKQDLYETKSAEIAQSLYNMGLIARERKDWSAAEMYFSQAGDIRAQVFGINHPKRADALAELAEIAWDTDQPAEALKLFKHSLDIYRQSFGLSHPHSLEDLFRLVEVYTELDQLDSAQHYLRLAWGGMSGQDQPITDLTALDTLTIRRYTPFVLSLANAHLKLLVNQGDALSAGERKTAHQAFRTVHAWLPTFLSLFNDASLWESVADQVQDFYRQSAVLAHRALNTPDSEPEVWQEQLLKCIQASRGATIQAAFKDRQAIQFAGVPDSLVQQGQVLKQQLQFALARQQSAEEEEDPLQNSQQQLSILQSWQELQQLLQQKYPQYYQSRFETPTVDIEKVLQTLKDEDYTVLAYFNLDTALLAVRIQPEALTSSWLAMPVGWQDSLQVYQQLLQRQRDLPRQSRLGYSLYQQLWRPIGLSPDSPIKILADGPLFYLNFETLLTQEPAEKASATTWPWLIKDFCVYYGHTLPGTTSQPSGSKGELLGVAPGFSQSLKETYLNSLPPGQAPDSVFLRWLRTPWSTSFVQQFQEKGWGEAITEQTATEKIFQQEAPRATILHFGTHARLENDKPLYSFLALTPDPNTQQDGYLYTYELYNEPLKAQLAVLTACETGLGNYRRGEGVLSLAHAFRYAGCPSVIYSLWSIDDQQSNQIAALFYENLQEDMSVAEALRAAKLKYLETAEGSLQSPYYWGGLVLTGDDQSVRLSSSPLNPWMIGGASVVLLLALLIIATRLIRRSTVS